MKVVINACFGGFGLSEKAVRFMAERGNEEAAKEIARYEKPLDPDDKFDAIHIEYNGGKRPWYGHMSGMKRDDPLLVEVVETLGGEADGEYAHLKVVEIPDGVDYEIDEYDGSE